MSERTHVLTNESTYDRKNARTHERIRTWTHKPKNTTNHGVLAERQIYESKKDQHKEIQTTGLEI